MREVRLRYVAQINPPTLAFSRLADDDELTFLPMESVWPGKWQQLSQVRKKADVAVGYTRFQDGDILVPKITPTFEASRSILVSGLLGGVGAGTTELHVVRPGPEIERRYLLYIFHTHPFLKNGEAEMYGVAGQQRVPDEFLRDFRVLIPSVSEQRRIADFLDAETARIGMLAHYRARQMQLLSLRSSSWTSQVYSYLSSKNPVIRLRRVLSLIEQGWSPECENRPAGPEEWGVLKAGCVNGGRFRREEQKALPKDLEPKIQYQIKEGDLLMSRASGSKELIGSTAVVPALRRKLLLCDKVYRLKVDGGKILPKYVALVASSPQVRQQIEMGVSGAGGLANNLPSGVVRNLEIPLPGQEEQGEVVRAWERYQQRTADLKASLERQLALLAERRQALITAAVTGQFDVTTAGRAGEAVASV